MVFKRALIGFFVQVIGLYILAGVSLWLLTSLIDAPTWAIVVVVLVTMAVSIGIYAGTLHDPIRDWIRDAKREQERHQPPMTR